MFRLGNGPLVGPPDWRLMRRRDVILSQGRRLMNRITIVAIIVGCCAVTNSVIAQQTNHHTIQWEANPYTAAQKARAESKAVMLHFTADWCGPCKNQKRFVFSNPTVIRAINQNFIPVLVDIDANSELAKELNVRTVPHDVFLTPDGEVITRRSSPADSNNFVGMCDAVNYRPGQGVAKANNSIEQFKRAMSPMEVDLEQRSNFRAAGPGAVNPVGVSEDSRQLANRSNYGQMINMPNRGNAQAAPQKLDPKMELQNAIAGLASASSNPNPIVQKSSFFKIPEKRLENPSAAYDPATNEFHPHRANENFDRKAFLAKHRPQMNVPRNAPAAEPVRVTNSQFFAQANQSKMSSSKTIPGLEVSGMFNASTGKPIDPTVSGQSVARIQQQTPSQPVAPANEAKIIAESNARIQSYKDLESEFAQQASMIKEEGAIASASATAAAANVAPVEDFALHGKCPVALIQQGQWIEGDARWGIVHRDRTYLFSSQANYDLFQSNPDRFSPVLSGFDPVVFHEQGKLIDGMEENGVFMGKNDKQHIVLFQSPETRAKFQANPKLYMDTVRQAVYSASRKSGSM